MSKIKNHVLIIVLSMLLIIGAGIAAIEVLHVRALNRALRSDIATIQMKYDDIKTHIDDAAKKSDALLLEKDSLQQEIQRLNAHVIELNNQIDLLRAELATASMPPHRKPAVVNPPVKKIVKKKKRIPYDISPSQQ